MSFETSWLRRYKENYVKWYMKCKHFKENYVKWYMKCKHFKENYTILHGLIRTHKWPTSNVSGLIAQLVRASHRYREVTGSNPVEILTFSGFCSQLLKLRSINCDDHGLLDFEPAVQYMQHFIYHFTSILHVLIRTHKWPAPQLVRASHRYREVTDSNPVEILTFSGFCSQLLKLRSNCDDHGLLERELCHPKCARKVSGLSTNGPLDLKSGDPELKSRSDH